MLLKLRLDTLWEQVDYFVIVESVKTISGQPKPLNFCIENFTLYRDKIRYLVLSEYPFPTDDAWRNERYQRDFVAHGLFDAVDEDWILVSDVDEIPRPETIKQFDPRRFVRGDFMQGAYSYYLNNQCFIDGKPVVWRGSKIVTYKVFRDFFGGAEQVRNFKSTGLLRAIKKAWFRNRQVQQITDGGWHFTWIADISQLIRKLESFAHQEYNTPEYKNPDTIRRKIEAGEDFLNPRCRCRAQFVDHHFPKQLTENPEFYSPFLLTADDK
jgi:beta-1,4-mannosyl-glycoprotein beta-1,4-N-acetylglucosaminyltransferase